MQDSRRAFIQTAGASLTLGALGLNRAWAQAADNFPSKPVTIIAASAPGGATDVLTRTLADLMGKQLGQTFVIDNKAGAGGTVGAQMVARANPDGYTLLMTHSAPIYYAPYLYSKLSYDPKKDFAFVSHICDGGLVLAVGKDVPARNIHELVAWIKRQGKGKVSYGSYAAGSAGHMLTAFLNETRDLGMQHVPYRGEAPMIQDMLRGEIPLAIGGIGTMIPHFDAGRLRPIAIFDPQRLPSLPDVPTMVESGFNEPEFIVIGGVMLLAPAATPPAIMAKLETAARAAVATPQMRARLQIYGMAPVGGTGAQARKSFDASGPRIERLVRISGAKID